MLASVYIRLSLLRWLGARALCSDNFSESSGIERQVVMPLAWTLNLLKHGSEELAAHSNLLLRTVIVPTNRITRVVLY
jgi:hypothetical protein